MSYFSSSHLSTRFSLLTLIALLLILSSTLVSAQTTLSTGSIVGTVTDPSGAGVGGAKVVIVNTGTNQNVALTSNSAGVFSTGALDPGNYKGQVSPKAFLTVIQIVQLQVG